MARKRETLARKLGFAEGERIAIVHCDDIGMCHAANIGAFEALDAGPATCGSVMVPCPWFEEAATMARARPDVDLGVHLTLNAEWSHYRWGPVLGASAVPSLVGADGCFFKTTAEVLTQAEPEEVDRELRAQVDRALGAGIDVTHLDAHMGTAMLPPLHEIYVQLAIDYALPVFFFRPDEGLLARLGLGPVASLAGEIAQRLERHGIPVLDGFDSDSLSFKEGEGAAHNRARLHGLSEGIHYLICHPAAAGEELSAITDSAHCREFERVFYGGPEGLDALAQEEVRTLGMRVLREFVRSKTSTRTGE
ncbi:MAG: polysaccharide deacetylase family protein [Myxococcota bacterium]|nr:polysaccharide deacetylase family protein [Myxococcota bacterium]